MDLLAAERLNGKRWHVAKIGAFLCFGVAGGLLIASLFLPPPSHGATDGGLSGNLAGTLR